MTNEEMAWAVIQGLGKFEAGQYAYWKPDLFTKICRLDKPFPASPEEAWEVELANGTYAIAMISELSGVETEEGGAIFARHRESFFPGVSKRNQEAFSAAQRAFLDTRRIVRFAGCQPAGMSFSHAGRS